MPRVENYGLWSSSLLIALLRKVKLGFVNGTSKRESQRTDIWNLWDKCKNIVHLWIIISVLKSSLNEIIYESKCTYRVGRSKGSLQQSESHKNQRSPVHLKVWILSLSIRGWRSCGINMIWLCVHRVMVVICWKTILTISEHRILHFLAGLN